MEFDPKKIEKVVQSNNGAVVNTTFVDLEMGSAGAEARGWLIVNGYVVAEVKLWGLSPQAAKGMTGKLMEHLVQKYGVIDKVPPGLKVN